MGRKESSALLLDQRVAAGEEEAVEVGLPEQRLAGLPFVDARADGGDAACGLELRERAVAALVEELAHFRVRYRLAAVGRHIDIVDQQDVDGLHPDPFEAGLVAAHHAVVGVVVHHLLLGRVEEEVLPLFVRGAIDEEPADLGREHDALAPGPLDGHAEALLGSPEARRAAQCRRA